MILVKPSEKIEKLLLITKLNNIFSIVESKEEAIEDKSNVPHAEAVSGYVTGNAKVIYHNYSSTNNFHTRRSSQMQSPRA